MAVCEKCGAELRDGAKFCSKCGAKIEEVKYCHQCGAKIPLDSVFCDQCGKNVEGGRALGTGDVVWEDANVAFTFLGVKTHEDKMLFAFSMKNKFSSSITPSPDIVPSLPSLTLNGRVLASGALFGGLPRDEEGLEQINPGKEERFCTFPLPAEDVKEFDMILGYCVRGKESRTYNWGEEVKSPMLHIVV